jgi:heme-degrading monooxygenase HmoA
MTRSHFLVVWEFEVSLEFLSEFERAYAADGSWARLFRRSGQYLGTELIRDAGRRGRYLTIDRWNSREALQDFKREHGAGYAALDKECEQLTVSESLVGEFESVLPSD